MPKAGLDIGSNSIKIAVIDDAGAVLLDDSRVVGLSKGLGDRGLFKADRMDAALAAIVELVEKARAVGATDIRAVATSGARRALNAATFFDRVRERTGVKVSTVSGEEEARLTWLGARFGLNLPGETVLFDLGGGSTEVVLGDQHTQPTLRVSLEIGAVRLTEAHLGTDEVDPAALAACRDHVRSELATAKWPRLPRAALAVGGTATTIGAMEQKLETFDAARIHGMRLDRAQLRRWIDRLLPATPDERRTIASIAPDRADFLLAGCVVLEACLEAARRESLIVSTGGVRYGLVAS